MTLHAIVNRKEATWMEKFIAAPYTTLAKTLHAYRQQLYNRAVDRAAIQRTNESKLKIVCISDTHNTQPELPPGDVLVHAGDLTQNGSRDEVQEQLDWLNKQPHSQKIVIAGNHDTVLDATKLASLPSSARERRPRWGSIIYLQDTTTVLLVGDAEKRLKCFGSPQTQKHGNWAFQYEKGIDSFSGLVPSNTDVLITHSPPQCHLDDAEYGDPFLLQELWRVKPRLHVFGHVHAGHGQEMLIYDEFEKLFAAVCQRRAGIVALIQMSLLLWMMYLVGPDLTIAKTILVNAAMIGGTRDNLKRKAHVVMI